MDKDGNIGLSYMVTGKSPDTAPSIRYTGRLKDDPLGQMTFTEKSAIEGSGRATCGNRIGDYSQISIDPSNDKTFWVTGHYFESLVSKTRIYSFEIDSSLSTDSIIDNTSLSLTVHQLDNELIINARNYKGKKNVQIDLFDITGKNVYSKSKFNATTNFEERVNVSKLSSGIYLVRIGNVEFQKVIKTIIR